MIRAARGQGARDFPWRRAAPRGSIRYPRHGNADFSKGRGVSWRGAALCARGVGGRIPGGDNGFDIVSACQNERGPGGGYASGFFFRPSHFRYMRPLSLSVQGPIAGTRDSVFKPFAKPLTHALLPQWDSLRLQGNKPEFPEYPPAPHARMETATVPSRGNFSGWGYILQVLGRLPSRLTFAVEESKYRVSISTEKQSTRSPVDVIETN